MSNRKVFDIYILCFTLPVFAQSDVTFVGDDIIGLDVSFQLGTAGTQPLLQTGMLGIGGRGGYYLGSYFFLDGEFLYEPNGWRNSVPGEPRDDRMVILGGIRAGTVFEDAIGVFAKARAGAFRFNAKNSYFDMDSVKDFYPVIDVGFIVERYWELNEARFESGKKFFVRMDIGTWIIPLGDTKTINHSGSTPGEINYYRMGTKNFLAMEFGFGFRF